MKKIDLNYKLFGLKCQHFKYFDFKKITTESKEITY